jgi:hypothetical protein
MRLSMGEGKYLIIKELKESPKEIDIIITKAYADE